MKSPMFCLAILIASLAHAQQAVLLVSLDGVRPDYITQADKHGLKIPHLRALLKDGTYAEGVRGVLPTSTYPSHTTIITGVWPAKHGIYFNKPFDVTSKTNDTWYWFSEDIRVPTLWDAAAGAGLTVGSVNWPVGIGAKAIKYNIGEYNQTHTESDLKMLRVLSGSLIDELGAKAGPYLMDVNKPVDRDWSRTKYTIEMIRQKHPRLLTFHLSAIDHIEHGEGPFTEPVLAAMEEQDKMVGALREAMLADDPKAVICIVSDHGFSRVGHVLKLDMAFVNAGLIRLRGPGTNTPDAGVANWKAIPWGAGGSAAILMKDSNDSETRAKVKKLLGELAADPANGIASVLDKQAIEKLGGAPTAEFWVDMKPGFMVGGYQTGPLVAESGRVGTHGYSPASSDMNSTFMIAGEGIAKGKSLGIIDMRSIAPTVAKVLGVEFKSADLPALEVQELKTP